MSIAFPSPASARRVINARDDGIGQHLLPVDCRSTQPRPLHLGSQPEIVAKLKRIVTCPSRCRLHLQFQEHGHAVPQRHRFPFRLGRVARSVEAGFCWPCRIRLSANYRRLRSESASRWLQVTPSRRRSADWIHFPRGRHARLSGLKGLWRVRCGQPPVGLEYLADVLDFADRTYRSSTEPASGDEIGSARGQRTNRIPQSSNLLASEKATGMEIPIRRRVSVATADPAASTTS